MFKRTLMALAMVGMVASPALADLLVPNGVLNPAHPVGAGTIGIAGASVNGSAVVSPGFLSGGVASQVSIPATTSDTIMVTFAFHWPFSQYYARPYLGVQFQNKLVYDNHEVQVLGANAVGGYTSVNFAGSLMTANPSSATGSGPSGTPLKGFPNPTSGIITTAPGFGRFAVNPPTTTSLVQPTSLGGTSLVGGQFWPFSSTFPIMKVTLHVKSVNPDGNIDLFIPPTSAFGLFKLVTATTVMNTLPPPFSSIVTTQTNTFIFDSRTFFTGSNVGVIGGDFGADVVPEPASAALMGIGLFSLVGGFWRRRRRMSR